MGSRTSTRWRLHERAATVESCLMLNIHGLAREELLTVGHRSVLRWYAPSGRQTSAIGLHVEKGLAGLALNLSYCYQVAGESHDVDQAVLLRTIAGPRGCSRWVAVCPGPGKAGCGRWANKLFLPIGVDGKRPRFACRGCHALTYASHQRHDARLDAIRSRPELLESLPVEVALRFAARLLASL